MAAKRKIATEYKESTTSRINTAEFILTPAEIRAARRKLGMSQVVFSETFGLCLDSFRKWEQGASYPRRNSQILLQVIVHEPDAVLRALKRCRTGQMPKAG